MFLALKLLALVPPAEVASPTAPFLSRRCNATLSGGSAGCPRRSWASAAACTECTALKGDALRRRAGCSVAELRAWCAELPVHPPSLPRLAPQAAAAVARARAAGSVSPQARPALRELLGSSSTNAWLKKVDTGDRLYELNGAELLARTEAELASAELVHNFGNPLPPPSCQSSLNCGFDLELMNMPLAADFYNQWSLQALRLVPFDPLNNAFTERAETKIFGYDPFLNASAPDVPTAAGRPYCE
jgi:hypothetical protein